MTIDDDKLSISVSPKPIIGEIIAPASKSYLQRALAIASFCNEPSTILNFYPSNDALVALDIVKKLGAKAYFSESDLFISKGNLNKDDVILNCGESGLCARMFSPIAATYNRKTKIVGEGSLQTRPVGMIIEALTKLGSTSTSSNGLLPINILTQIKAGNIEIDGSETSQLLTGLLIALPTINGDSTIQVHQLKSIPYVQMTLDLLNLFGIKIKHSNYRKFEIRGNQTPTSTSYFVEGDWSGAAFHLVGAAISGKILVKGLNINSAQADRAIIDALSKSGAHVELLDDAILVSKNKLFAFEFDATHCPDLFPPLAALAACCEGTSIIKGVSRLKNKESDRAIALKEEFFKLNIKIDLQGDLMYISKSEVKGGIVSSRNDHRIAMATAILASVADSEIKIDNYTAVNKSYPTFFDDLERLTF